MSEHLEVEALLIEHNHDARALAVRLRTELVRLHLMESAIACGCLSFCEPCPECEVTKFELIEEAGDE